MVIKQSLEQCWFIAKISISVHAKKNIYEYGHLETVLTLYRSERFAKLMCLAQRITWSQFSKVYFDRCLSIIMFSGYILL